MTTDVLFHVELDELPAGFWIAHDYPERPADNFVVWSWGCDACMIHLVLTAHLDPDHHAHEFTEDIGCTTTTATTLEAARRWRAEQGLRPL